MITYNQLNQISNPNIVDIRTKLEYNKGHIPRSINIEVKDLINNPKKYLNKKETYYLYCNYGNTSKKVCEILKSKNYKTINIIGGYLNYKRK